MPKVRNKSNLKLGVCLGFIRIIDIYVVNLGQLMFFGQEGVRQNLRRSFEYFKQALDSTQGDDSNLEYSVAIMKYKGTGTLKDPDGAREMYEKSINERHGHLKRLK